jgi:hypothetical protein
MARSAGPRPDQATKDAVTERIVAHARRHWPHIEVLVRYSGEFCYVAVVERPRTRWEHGRSTSANPSPFCACATKAVPTAGSSGSTRPAPRPSAKTKARPSSAPPSAPPKKAWTTHSVSGSDHLPPSDQPGSPAVTSRQTVDHENGETSEGRRAGDKEFNRSLARLRAPAERGIAHLKNWWVLSTRRVSACSSGETVRVTVCAGGQV